MLAPVTYVLAHKKATRNVNLSGEKASPQELVQINIYLVTAMKYYEDSNQVGFMLQDSAGGISTKMYDKKGENKETNINLSGKEMIKKNPMKIQLDHLLLGYQRQHKP